MLMLPSSRAGQPLGAGEMAEERGAGVLGVAPLDAELAGEERLAARCVDEEPRAPVARAAPSSAAAVTADLVRHEVDAGDARAFAHFRARAPRSAEAAGGRTRTGAPGRRTATSRSSCSAKSNVIVLRVLGGAELRAVLHHRDRRDLVADAEPLEERHVERQQRLADVEARVAVVLEHRDVAARAGQERGDRRAGGAAADHEHVAAVGRL